MRCGGSVCENECIANCFYGGCGTDCNNSCAYNCGGGYRGCTVTCGNDCTSGCSGGIGEKERGPFGSSY